MLQASSASADLPIWHGRLRPISGELPNGTYKFIGRTTVEYPTVADAMIETSLISLGAHRGQVADLMIEALYTSDYTGSAVQQCGPAVANSRK